MLLLYIAMTSVVRHQLAVIGQFIDIHRRLHRQLVTSTVQCYQYTTLADTKQVTVTLLLL